MPAGILLWAVERLVHGVGVHAVGGGSCPSQGMRLRRFARTSVARIRDALKIL